MSEEYLHSCPHQTVGVCIECYNQLRAQLAESQKQEPVAWLWKLKKPGKFITYATVEPDSTEHWPIDEWTKIESFPLYTAAPIPDAMKGEPVAEAFMTTGGDDEGGFYSYLTARMLDASPEELDGKTTKLYTATQAAPDEIESLRAQLAELRTAYGEVKQMYKTSCEQLAESQNNVLQAHVELLREALQEVEWDAKQYCEGFDVIWDNVANVLEATQPKENEA